MKPIALNAKTYPLAAEALIVVCTDAIIIDKKNKLFYLAQRCVQPMKGFWSIGGRRYTGEPGFVSVARNFKKETSLDISFKRFKPLIAREFIWKMRKESPSNVGKHDIIQFYTIELTKKEIDTANAHLCLKEYIYGSLEPFDYKRLKAKKIHQGLIDNYELIFGK